MRDGLAQPLGDQQRARLGRAGEQHEELLAAGEGKINEDTGKRTPLDVAEGDTVLYSKYGGTEIKVDGEDLLVLRESDVLAKVEK